MENRSLIPIDKIIERLQYENPWWATKKIPADFESMRRRLYFDLFYPFVTEKKVRRAVVLMGPRRVGKTVMMFHTISKLLEENIHPHRILFAGIDNPIYIHLTLEDILNLFKEALKLDDLKDCYIFFDEIQYLKDWERHLKVLVDSYPNTKFIVSGSAAAALRRQSTESGAGRFTDFLLPPLTFQEYIHLKNLEHLVVESSIEYGNAQLPYFVSLDIKALNKEFLNYINFGGYPEVVLSERIQSDMGRFVKNDIVDKVLLRDLPSLYGIRNVQELNRFFTYLAYNTGQQLSYENMCNDSSVSKDQIRKYLEYLESAFLIKVLNKVDINAKRLKRITNFKVYLTNPSLRTALFSPVSETDKEIGHMIETAILSQWMHRENLDLTYAAWKNGKSEGEVDIVCVDNKYFKPVWAVEVKWSDKFYSHPKELKSLLKFCEANTFDKAVVTTIEKTGNQKEKEVAMTFIPSSVYAYNVGVNTLKQKTNLQAI